MERLWRAANISDLGTSLSAVEEAWEQGDDARILETFKNSAWRDDTLVDFVFLELMSEDEERALPIWRAWVRDNLRSSKFWRTTKVVMARGNLDTFENLTDRQRETGGLTRLDILGARMDRILIEEAERKDTSHNQKADQGQVSEAAREPEEPRPEQAFEHLPFDNSEYSVQWEYLDALADSASWGELWGQCYRDLKFFFNIVARSLGDNPAMDELLPYLDTGQTAFFQAMEQAKNDDLLSVDQLGKAKELWSTFFSKWESWFRENHPEYFER